MGRLIFVLGGARSGKSSFAVQQAKSLSNKICFVATAIPFDTEMKRRIEHHKKERPKSWCTVDEPKDLAQVLRRYGSTYPVLIIDCLTILINNNMMDSVADKAVLAGIKKTIQYIKKIKSTVIIVANEVGSGIVPGNALSRRFRDMAGRVNQVVAEAAGEVYLMTAGISTKIKG